MVGETCVAYMQILLDAGAFFVMVGAPRTAYSLALPVLSYLTQEVKTISDSE